ncbi:MAG: DivIVA domain-containing protein [Coriobacteriaceae bacterium]|nr:DivIVA domain-containing protein [Coriobacteriaceae bacterium]MDY5808736.1 DivIVA domain-containing protein [Coriobacteriales bacterium]
MPITPAEIQQKTFSEAKRRGYEPSEVDEFLEQISRDIDAMLRKIADLKNRLTAAEAKNGELQGEIEKVRAEADKAVADARAAAPAAPANNGKPNIYSATEEQLSAALIVAQQTADRIVAEAKSNAERIRLDADNQARKVIRQALDEKQTELDEIERLKVSRENFRTEYLALIQKFSDAASANFPLITSAPSGSEAVAAAPSAAATQLQAAVNPYGTQVQAAIDDLD